MTAKKSKQNEQEYRLGLEGKMNMVRMAVRAVTRDYKKSRLITGCLEESTEIDVLVDEEIFEKIIKMREKKQALQV